MLYSPEYELNPGKYRLSLLYSLLPNGINSEVSLRNVCVSNNQIIKEYAKTKLKYGFANTDKIIFNIDKDHRCEGKYQVIISVSGDEELYINDFMINRLGFAI